MAIPKDEHSSYTYQEYLTWPEDQRWELIEGIPYAMSPAPSITHQRISLELSRQIANYLEDKACEVFAAPFDVILMKKEEDEGNAKNVVQPDISVVCDREKLSDDKKCKGAPDLIIEIVSPSSVQMDYVKKLNLYMEFGVREYWIVNPKEYTVMVYDFSKSEEEQTPHIYNKNEKISVGIFKDLVIDLTKVFRS